MEQVHRYHDQSVALHGGLSRYFNKRLFSDLTVVAPDGRKLLCHQLVLSACSKRFAAILEHGTLQGTELPVWGVDSGALEAILHFFYTGECCLTLSSVVGVLDAAQRLEVPGVASACEAFVRGVLRPGTACFLLGQALQFKVEELVDVCLGFITSRFDEVVTTEDFLTCPFNALMRILTAAKAQQSELALFRAAWSWVVSDCKHVQYLEDILKVVTVPHLVSFPDLIAMGTGGRASGGGAGGPRLEGLSISQLQQAALHHGSARALDLSGSVGASAGMLMGLGLQFGSGDEGAGPEAGKPASSGSGAAMMGAAAAAPTPRSGGMLGLADARQVLQQAIGGPAPGLPAVADGRSMADAVTGGADYSQPQLQQGLPLLPSLGASRLTSNGGLWPASNGPAYSAPLPAAPALLTRLPLAPGLHSTYPSIPGIAADVGFGMGQGGIGAQVPQSDHAGPTHGRQSDQGDYGRHRQQSGDDYAGHGARGEEDDSTGDADDSPTNKASGRVSGGSVMHRGLAAKGVCQVEGCRADLRGLRDYHMRYKICEQHLKVSSIIKDGKPQRFCQQCGRFHLLTDFDGNKRSCRARLQRHNARRRKRPGEDDGPVSPTKKPRPLSSAGASGLEDDMHDAAMGGGSIHGGAAVGAGMGRGGAAGGMGAGGFGAAGAGLQLGGSGGNGIGLPGIGSVAPQQFMQAIKVVAEQQGLDPAQLPQMLLGGLASGSAGLSSAPQNGTAAARFANGGSGDGVQLDLGAAPNGVAAGGVGGGAVTNGGGGTARRNPTPTPNAVSSGGAAAAGAASAGGRGPHWGLDILANVAQHNVAHNSAAQHAKEQRPPSSVGAAADKADDLLPMSWGPKGRRSGTHRSSKSSSGSEGPHPTSPKVSEGTEHESQQQQQGHQQGREQHVVLPKHGSPQQMLQAEQVASLHLATHHGAAQAAE